MPALAALVFAISLWQNLAAIPVSRFHPDESRWLNRAHYIRDVLDPRGAVWEDRYLIRGQPPVGSYVTGLGLLLQGRDLTTNGPWDFRYGNESNITWNVIKGNMPSRADLEAGRRTSAAAGALTCLILFLIVTRLSHWVGGLVGALFLAFHPLHRYLSSLAVSDAVFTLFVALATLAIIGLASRPNWSRTLLLGAVLGLGAGIKLSPLFVSILLAGFGLLLLADSRLRRLRFVGGPWSWLSRVEIGPHRRLGWMLLTLPAITAATFVATYPYLWPDPIGRTYHLLEFRQQEMDNQARIWPHAAVDSRIEALQRTWRTLEHLYSTSGRGLALLGRALGREWDGGLDVPLGLAGLAIFTWLAWRHGLASRHALALALLGSQSAVILAKLRVDFDRYYLPFVLVLGVGVGLLVGQVWLWAAPRLSRQRSAVGRQGTAPQRVSLSGTRASGPLQPAPHAAPQRSGHPTSDG